jgi:hypothetical protein
MKWKNPDFWAFMACRAMVGIGEASYSTIAPTIISDMFVKDMRSKMLALFYFAIPVGRYNRLYRPKGFIYWETFLIIRCQLGKNYE